MSHARFDPVQRPGPMGPRQAQGPPDDASSSHPLPARWTMRGSPVVPSFLSVVVPAKNEAASLTQLTEEIVGTLRPLCNAADGSDRPGRPSGFEILIVDDGSTDHTARVLTELAARYPELRPLQLKSNVGQSAAIAAGIDA